MRIAQYLQVSEKLKSARISSGISQKDMAKKLKLSNSAYSNYENGYSEPPMEVILDFCSLTSITTEQLFGFKIDPSNLRTVQTFADFIAILIDLDRRGLPIKAETTYSVEENQLTAHLTLDMLNAQLATFIPDWNNTNQQLRSGEIDEEEYQSWLDDNLKLFNVPIDDYVSS